jgi:hypothetical protein
MEEVMSRKNRKRAAGRPQGVGKQPILLAAGGFVLLLVAFLAWRGLNPPKAEIQVSGAPSLQVDKERVDLGDVPLGQTVSVSFEVSNAGDEPLHFSEAPYVEVVEGC